MANIDQTTYGKAFEYACLMSLEDIAGKLRRVLTIENSSLVVAKNAWLSLDESTQSLMHRSSVAGIKSLIEMEPKIVQDGNDDLELSLQKDSQGQVGDVRDILIIRRQLKWEIGISAKHNHEAVKNSRLSPKIDFGKEWLGINCSETYFQEIAPIFERINNFKQSRMRWGEVADKESTTYVPLLKAFMGELRRLDAAYPEVVPNKLLEYLLGRKDFYKLISNDAKRYTTLQCFNLHGTLNTPSSERQPSLHVGRVPLPKKILYLDFSEKNGNVSSTTLQLVMDNNWAVSFRIHSAKSTVENSLKFDVQLTGIPTSLFTNSLSWQA